MVSARLYLLRGQTAAGQGKYIASLDVDHSGSRVVAGSRDYSVRLFDFNGMKSDMKSFRRIEPFDGHPVHAVSWSPSGAPQIHACTPHFLLYMQCIARASSIMRMSSACQPQALV